MSQKNTAKMTNNMPETQALQNKLTDAKHRGDLYDQAKYSMELQKLMKDPEKGVSPIASIAPLMVQMPFFIGMFMGLRGMANLPVERYLYVIQFYSKLFKKPPFLVVIVFFTRPSLTQTAFK